MVILNILSILTLKLVEITLIMQCTFISLSTGTAKYFFPLGWKARRQRDFDVLNGKQSDASQFNYYNINLYS